MTLYRLSYQSLCVELGDYQTYEVKPDDQLHCIELSIIPDPVMSPEYKVESYKECRELVMVGRSRDLSMILQLAHGNNC